MSRNSIWILVMLLAGLTAAYGYEYDEDPKVIDVADSELRAAMSPEVNALGNAWWDDNDISFMQWGAEARVWPTAGLPLRLQFLTGEIEQDSDQVETNFDRTAFGIALDGYRPVPALGLKGRILYEDFDDGDLLGGQAELRVYRESGSEYAVYGASESLWAQTNVRNPRQYPRVSDLSQLDQNLRVNTIGGMLDFAPSLEQQIRLNASWSEYEEDKNGDDNEKLSAYVHWQVPILNSTSEKWLTLRPSIYYEHFRDELPGYYSPDYHVSLGIGLHTVRKYAHKQVLEIEVKPEWIFRNPDNQDEDTVAIHVILDYSVEIKKLLLGVGGFLYAEEEDYWLGVVSGKIGFRF
ncbi:MAG: hypothetical protein AB7T27_06395 [Kiritimatiellia bacterium]